LKEPSAGKTEYLDKLVEEGDSIDLTLSYSRGPFREAYYVHSVLRAEPTRARYRNPTKLIELPYRHGARGGYRKAWIPESRENPLPVALRYRE